MAQDRPSESPDRDVVRVRTGTKQWDAWALGIAAVIIASLFSLWLNSISASISDLKASVDDMDRRLRAVEISVGHIKGHLGMTAGDEFQEIHPPTDDQTPKQYGTAVELVLDPPPVP